jgi:PAS domain S-box-containing protein
MSKDVQAIMWSLDLDTLRYLSASDATLELLGYSREELLNMTIFDIIAPEDRERLEKHLPCGHPPVRWASGCSNVRTAAVWA